jgi:thiaminase (transcriptional activator TenA)
MDKPLTDRLWSSSVDTYRAILDHPFIQGLTDGTLPRDVFRYYIIQDALYLLDYARSLAICAAKAPHDDATKMFAEHVRETIVVERSLHRDFLIELDVSDREMTQAEMAPTNLAYTSYLLSAAYGGSFPEALAAVLPCYVIYEEVGKTLAVSGSPNPLYQGWIDTYGGDAFADVVKEVRGLADKVGAQLTGIEEAVVEDRFQTTARYEWMFWEMAYRQEKWPV